MLWQSFPHVYRVRVFFPGILPSIRWYVICPMDDVFSNNKSRLSRIDQGKAASCYNALSTPCCYAVMRTFLLVSSSGKGTVQGMKNPRKKRTGTVHSGTLRHVTQQVYDDVCLPFYHLFILWTHLRSVNGVVTWCGQPSNQFITLYFSFSFIIHRTLSTIHSTPNLGRHSDFWQGLLFHEQYIV